MRTFWYRALVATLPIVLGLAASKGVAQDTRAATLDPPTKTAPVAIKGHYWALLIGIEKYKDSSISTLRTPVNDVTELAKILKARYGFTDERITVLLDEKATRESIEGTLYRLGQEVGPDDSLLIYYAGHGHMDAGTRGFWIPADGKGLSPGTWINNAVIRDAISGMRAKHVYLVADSCFSGTLFAAGRSLPPEDDEKYFQRLHGSKSRWGLTSGMNEPVADDGKDGHSIFAYFFLKALKENEKGYLTPSQISVSLSPLVSRNADQQPRSQPLQGAGDEGGQFLFIRKTNWIIAAKSIHRENALPEGVTAQWYHSPIGARIFPYDWFLALLSDELFRNNLYRTGFWSDPDHPDRLPVGISKTQSPDLPMPSVGVTCAACHTTQFTYKGTIHRMEGGTSLQFNFRFLRTLVESLREVLTTAKFPDFAKEVLSLRGQPVTNKNIEQLNTDVTTVVSALNYRLYRDASREAWGPGRYDLFGRAANAVSVPLDMDNYRPADVPVSIPSLWGTAEYDWMTWSGSIEHPLARDIAHLLATSATPIVYTRQMSESHKLEYQLGSSIDIASLRELGHLAMQISPPRWSPSFPPINRELAARGKDLYHGNKEKGIPNLCASCHVGVPIRDPLPNGPSIHVTMVPQTELGTDRWYLDTLSARKVDLERIGYGRVGAKEASLLVTTELMTQNGVANDPEYLHRTNKWRDLPQYIARPHLAVWATAPFLHNGSIPNLYTLLSPAKERPSCFYFSPNMEFDPVNVGYMVTECTGSPGSLDPLAGFEFRTELPGNSNRGHEFRNGADCSGPTRTAGTLGCELPPADRWAIIEYLKTCDLDRLVLRDSPVCRDLE